VILVIVGLGAAAFGLRFRLYSAATVLVMIVFGAWSGTYGADVADDLETPWVGVIERISVFAYQLWFVVFAVALLALAHSYRTSTRLPGRALLPAPGSSSEAVHRPARVNVTCVTPPGEEAASTS
jgi:hypothetical protein